VSGFALLWHACSGEAINLSPEVYISNTPGYNDTSFYGTHDSLRFSYSNFDGGSYAAEVAFQSFGRITSPDTVATSQGCTLHYEKFLSRDSITVTISGGMTLTVPDTGAIVLPPNFALTNLALVHWNIMLFRPHFSSLLSPQGKRIGISTLQIASGSVLARP
jgi:hypothetical protein